MQSFLSFPHHDWEMSFSKKEEEAAIDGLEAGQLLLFPHLAFALEKAEQRFLNPAFLAPKSKNISYSLAHNTVKGATASEEELAILHAMMRRFALSSQGLIEKAFPHYIGHLIVGRTSYRPARVSDRQTSYRKDDRLLHVDAFPATPTGGLRILRVFSNINSKGEPRVWHTGEDFRTVAETFFPRISPPWPGKHALMHVLNLTKSKRSLYDHYMLNIHNRMKEDQAYQKRAIQARLELPAHSTWIVETDAVSHAALSGQFMLEQTFYLKVPAMMWPERSPLRILESLVGKGLV